MYLQAALTLWPLVRLHRTGAPFSQALGDKGAGEKPRAEAQVSHLMVRVLRAGHSDGLEAGALSADGRTLLTTAYDGSARLWDLVLGQCLAVLVPGGQVGPSRLLTRVLTSPDQHSSLSMRCQLSLAESSNALDSSDHVHFRRWCAARCRRSGTARSRRRTTTACSSGAARRAPLLRRGSEDACPGPLPSC